MSTDTLPDDKPAAPPADVEGAKAGCTLPGCASCLTGLLLLALALTAWSVFFLGQDNVRDALTWPRMALVVGLIIVIPLVLYKVLQLWLEGEPSQFPDIDYAWEAGLDELARHGLSLDSLPLFLVLGSSGDAQEQALAQAAGFEFKVRAVPEGEAALHWYANATGIYLFCTDASWLSAVAWLSAQKASDAAPDAPLTLAPAATFRAPPAAVQPAPALPAPPPPAAPVPLAPPAPQWPLPAYGSGGSGAGRGTIMLDQFLQQQPAAGPAPIPTPAPPAVPMAAPVAAVSEPERVSEVYTPEPSLQLPSAAQNDSLAIVSPSDASDRLQRLQYVCQLLRRARQPLCAINGILTLLPFQTMRATPEEAEELQRAIRSDLLAIQRSLQLRCPVTALITGLEAERGFSELVRRVGPERAATQRFGRKFDVRALATSEELIALCDHVCGAFDDWVYALFREQGALTRPGNTRLYALLCRVRCHLKPRLTELLSGGFGHDGREAPRDLPFLFSGCYFAATGDTPDRQAFVRGVFEKLGEEQEFVEWSPQALASNRRLLWLSYAGLAVSVGLLGTLTVMFVRRGF